MRGIPIRDRGEPLVDFVARGLILDTPRFHYRREAYAREGLAERLLRAHEALRRGGYGLLILECWRPPFIQRRMFLAVEADFREKNPDLSPEALRTLVERYSAPDDDDAPPPHTTGGATDLWLAGPDGKPADLHAPFGFRDPEGFAFDAEGLTPEARANRDRLGEALDAQGITNYPSEYWHWSHGDQGWAYRGSHPEAVYGATTPEGWTPNPDDDTGEPLEFTEDERDAPKGPDAS